MSGGAYNYLAYTDVEDLLTKHLEDLADMGYALAARGYVDAAQETYRLLADARAYTARTNASMARLEGVWKAVEWVDSSDWSEDSIEEAVRKYRDSGL